MEKLRILVIGGYGFFGCRLIARLCTRAGLHITVAGRTQAAGAALVQKLRPLAKSELACCALDAMHHGLLSQLRLLQPHIVVNASGPFQGQDYRVAQACIVTGAHYIDLADGREFVTGIGVLDGAARNAGVLVTSGASSVPALSSAVADELALGLRSVDSINIGISPGNRTERGLSTMRGVLSYCGKPVPSAGGRGVVGWLDTYVHTYPSPVGVRLHSPCDVPDLALLPLRYPGHPKLRFGAGLEIKFLQRCMNLMAWWAHCGFVKDWSAYAQGLKRIADLFVRFGTDAGGMYVSLEGTDSTGQAVCREWQLVATHGDGPYVPTLAAAALIRKILLNPHGLSGAMPCVRLLTLSDFAHEMQGLNISPTRT